jgi:hypothetical protein
MLAHGGWYSPVATAATMVMGRNQDQVIAIHSTAVFISFQHSSHTSILSFSLQPTIFQFNIDGLFRDDLLHIPLAL